MCKKLTAFHSPCCFGGRVAQRGVRLIVGNADGCVEFMHAALMQRPLVRPVDPFGTC